MKTYLTIAFLLIASSARGETAIGGIWADAILWRCKELDQAKIPASAVVETELKTATETVKIKGVNLSLVIDDLIKRVEKLEKK
jgi:hypothetical protein